MANTDSMSEPIKRRPPDPDDLLRQITQLRRESVALRREVAEIYRALRRGFGVIGGELSRAERCSSSPSGSPSGKSPGGPDA